MKLNLPKLVEKQLRLGELPVRKKIPNLFAFLQALKMPSVISINSTSFKIPGKYQQNVFEFLLGLLDYRVHLCK